MYVVGIHPKIFNKLLWFLRKNGLWVERHSYSFRVMYRGRFVASFHIYPGYNIAVLRLYSGKQSIDRFVEEKVLQAFNKYLPDYRVDIEYI